MMQAETFNWFGPARTEGPQVKVTMTESEAEELYLWLESDESSPYWTNRAPGALQAALSAWRRTEGPI